MIVFGLGNPGKAYSKTRHNLGFMVIDNLSKRLGAKFKHHPEFYISYSKEFILVKPLSYINNSGVVVKEVLAQHPGQDFLAVCDDVNLPLGRLRLRPKGGDGGHNGLASIIYYSETEDFPRLRLGIGPPIGDLVEFVLSEFTEEEIPEVERMIEEAGEAINRVLSDGLDIVMNRVNPGGSG